MTYLGWILLAAVFAGAAWLWSRLYQDKDGPTACIGCGECIATGECVMRRKMAQKKAEKSKDPS